MRRFLSIAAFVLLAVIIGIGYRQLGLTSREASAVTSSGSLPVTVIQEAIASAPLSSSSFSGDAAVGTVIGGITPTLTPAASFNGTVTLSTTAGGCNSSNGSSNTLFQIVGTNLETNALNPGGTYQVCYLVTQTGANNSPLGFPVTLTASQTLQAIALSNNTVVSNSNGATVGTLSTTMSPVSPAFSGSYSLSNGSGCANPSSTNFQIVGSTLETNAALVNGTYCITVTATQGGISNSPISQAETITASGTQLVASVNLSNNSFNGGSPSGTAVGNFTVTMNPTSPAFTGTLVLSTSSGGCTVTTGANNASFQLVGSGPWVLETNGVVAAGSYAVCVAATQSGVANSPFGASFTIQGQPQTISTIVLSNSSFVGGSSSGTTIGTISVVMSPTSPAFNGSLSLSTTAAGCTSANGANNSSFQIVGSALETSGVVAAGTYAVCIAAAETGTTNSPQGQPFSIMGTVGAFPVSISSGKLVNVNSQPFVIVGDSPQALINLPICTGGNTAAACASSTDAVPNQATMVAYFRDRHAQGINTVWVNILCENYTGCPVNGTDNLGGNGYGNHPFTGHLATGTYFNSAGGTGETCPSSGWTTVDCVDLATPDTTNYWPRIDALFGVAAQFGIQIIADPLPTDNCANPGSFMQTFGNNYVVAPSKVTGFASFLAARYASTPNIIWMVGNDYSCPTTGSPVTSDTVVFAFAQALHSADPGHLMTLEMNQSGVSLDDAGHAWSTILGLNGVYYYQAVYDGVLHAYGQNSTTVLPFNVEPNYETENNCGNFSIGCPSQPWVAGRDRNQFWWTVLSGGQSGYMYGSTASTFFCPNSLSSTFNPCPSGAWNNPASNIDTTELGQLANYGQNFLTANNWSSVVPDAVAGNSAGHHTFVYCGSSGTGCGTYCTGATCSNVPGGTGASWVSAAVAANGSVGLAYFPDTSTAPTVNTTKIVAPVSMWWYDVTADPTVGSSYAPICSNFGISGVSACGASTQTVTVPAAANVNDATTHQYVLLAQSNASAPVIQSVALSANTFTANSPTGTVIGQLSAPLTKGVFAGTYATIAGSTADPGCTGSNTTASNFTIVGANLETNSSSLASGTYCIKVTATESGLGNSPFTTPASLVITAQQQTIASISPTTGSFASTGGTGQTVATMSATMSPTSPSFSSSGGTWALNAGGGATGCPTSDTTDFSIGSSSGVITNSTITAGSYSLCVQATDASASNSPKYQTVAVTGTTAGPVAFALPTGDVVHYMSPTGSDSNNGTSPSTPWLTPNHALHCGDVIIAAAGTYTTQFSSGYGTVSNCPSTTGGIDGTGGVYFATVLCAGPNLGSCPVNGSGTNVAFDLGSASADHWAFEGFYTTGAANSRCYMIDAPDATTVIHHNAFINDIAYNCLVGFGINDCPGGNCNHNSPGDGADYWAVVGDIAQNSAQDGICVAAIDTAGTSHFDTVAGTHKFIYGNFSYNHQNTCATDVEAYMMDTPDAHDDTTQYVWLNNTGWLSYRYNMQLFEQSFSAPNAPVFVEYNTYTSCCTSGNGGLGSINTQGGAGTSGNFTSLQMTISNNIDVETRGSDTLALWDGNHGIVAGGSQTISGNNFYSTATACDNICLPGSSPYSGVTFQSSTSVLGATGQYGVNPALRNVSDLTTNRSGVPNCSAFTNVTACMGYNANTSTLTTPSAISDLQPTTAGMSGDGYQLPSTTCVTSSSTGVGAAVFSLYPTWLKGIVYLQWNSSNSTISEYPDLVTKPCGM